jgi:hypothetical protein
MELRTYNQSREAVSLDAFGLDVARRLAAARPIMMPRNAGDRRTESKYALLAALEQTGARW